MTRPLRSVLVMIAAVAVVGLGRWQSEARDDPAQPKATRSSVEEALSKPFAFPFAKETTLEEVAKSLSRSLDAPVVLDLAAVNRLGQSAESKVKLDLNGVRLKTGLKLLLDQVDMTYKVVPEDNLLILTDAVGTDDPTSRVLSELKTLHREVHDLHDAFDELNRSLAPVEEPANVRKPTIIEEMPPGADKPKPEELPARSRPGL